MSGQKAECSVLLVAGHEREEEDAKGDLNRLEQAKTRQKRLMERYEKRVSGGKLVGGAGGESSASRRWDGSADSQKSWWNSWYQSGAGGGVREASAARQNMGLMRFNTVKAIASWSPARPP